jgi:hypothetical protein
LPYLRNGTWIANNGAIRLLFIPTSCAEDFVFHKEGNDVNHGYRLLKQRRGTFDPV